jgi:sigma-B regulation protein RsbU (phosphoserine phosphatase)
MATSDDSDVHQPSASAPGDVQSISDEVPALLQAELHKSFVQRFVIEHELGLAQEIQRALIPQHLPTFDGYAVSGHCEPAQRVGGDFYDFRAMSSGGAVAFLGDVAGKGVAASLLSSMALGCLDAQLRSDERLDSALVALNSILCEKEPGRFVTLFLVRFDPGGECCYASAGHNTAYVYHGEHTEIEELPSTGLIAGVIPECEFASECFTLRAGDVLLAYSDGLTDAESPTGEMLREDAVRSAVLEYASAGAESLKGALLDLVLSFTGGEKQSDDITFFVIERI